MDKSRTQAIVYMVFSSFSFALMQFFVKISSSNINIMAEIFSRNFLTLIISGILMIKSKEIFIPKKENIKWILLRFCTGFLGVYTFFYATKHALLTDTAILQRSSPIFIMIFSAIFLKVPINKVGVVTLVLAILGSVFVIRPHMSSSVFPLLVALLSAIFAGISYTVLSFTGGKESSNLMVFYFSLLASILAFILSYKDYAVLHLADYGMLFLISITAALGQIFLTMSYHDGNPNTVSIFTYSGVIVSFILGISILKESISIYSFIGVALIIISAFITYFKGAKRTELSNS